MTTSIVLLFAWSKSAFASSCVKLTNMEHLVQSVQISSTEISKCVALVWKGNELLFVVSVIPLLMQL